MSAIEKLKAIQGDDYWDCSDDTEQLTHSEPLEAIEYHLDGWLSPNCDTEAVIREKCSDGLTVYAWQRKTVTDADVERVADDCLDAAEEAFGEQLELSDPDGDGSDFNKADRERARPLFEAAVRSLYEGAQVWACERFAKVELTCDELLELCRSEFPHWFEVSA